MKTRNKSIRKQLFTKRLLMLLIPQLITLILFLVFTLSHMKTYISDSINKNSHNILTQTQKNMELIMDEISTIQLTYDYDPTIPLQVKAALNNKLLSLTELYLLDVANRFLSSSVNAKPYIHSVYIYYTDVEDFFIASDANALAAKVHTYHDVGWLETYKNRQDVNQMWVEHRTIYLFSTDPGREVISIYKPLKDQDGVIVFNIDPTYIKDSLDQLSISPSQLLIILDNNGQIISQSGSGTTHLVEDLPAQLDSAKEMSTIHLGGKRFVARRKTSAKYDWQYVSLTPFMDVYQVPIKTILLALLAVTVAIFFSVYITLHQTRENFTLVNNMVTLIEAAEKGEPLPPLTPRNENVYSFISENIVKTFIEQKYLKTQLSEKQYRLKAMELLALQSQINPHFLYNTLENIYWKIIRVMKGPSDTSTMIENLSDILRYSLSSPEKKVILKEEVHHTTCYLDLLKIRYEDKFDYDLVIAPELLGTKVVKLFLQPFVENAIYHGIKNKEKQSHLRLRCFKHHDHMVIHILDTGIGMTPSELKRIRDKTLHHSQDFSHIGISNTCSRLRLLHGDAFSIRVLSKHTLGTCVTLNIPL